MQPARNLDQVADSTERHQHRSESVGERTDLGRTRPCGGASTTRQDQHERKTITSDIKYADIRVQLTGTSGSDFMEEASGGGVYDHHLQTVMRWVAVS